MIRGRRLHTIQSLNQIILALQIFGKTAKTIETFYAVIKDQTLRSIKPFAVPKKTVVTVLGYINADK